MEGMDAMRIVAVIPAYRNEQTIGYAVRALLEDGRVAEVIVVDDGSDDATGARATEAGARVVSLPRNVGKGGALEAGVAQAGLAEVILFVDGDTGPSARAAADLLDPIRAGEADMVIGVLPGAGTRGGFGVVRRTAGWLIALTSGLATRAPLSGQRAVTRSVLLACRPLAAGFGVDAALTADAAKLKFRILEQSVQMEHAHRGRDITGFAHRAGQGLDLLRAFVPRLLRRKQRRGTTGPEPHS